MRRSGPRHGRCHVFAVVFLLVRSFSFVLREISDWPHSANLRERCGTCRMEGAAEPNATNAPGAMRFFFFSCLYVRSCVLPCRIPSKLPHVPWHGRSEIGITSDGVVDLTFGSRDFTVNPSCGGNFYFVMFVGRGWCRRRVCVLTDVEQICPFDMLDRSSPRLSGQCFNRDLLVAREVVCTSFETRQGSRFEG